MLFKFLIIICHWCDINLRHNTLILDNISWWRHQMETFSALLAICTGNSPGPVPTLRPVTRSFDVYFDLHPNKRLSKQSSVWWLETPSRPLWRHRNATQTHFGQSQPNLNSGPINLTLNQYCQKHTYDSGICLCEWVHYSHVTWASGVSNNR